MDEDAIRGLLAEYRAKYNRERANVWLEGGPGALERWTRERRAEARGELLSWLAATHVARNDK